MINCSPLRLLAAFAWLMLPIHLVLADDHSNDVLDPTGSEFMLNEATATIVHEWAHSLSRDYQIFTLGNQETAADNFVPFIMFKPSEAMGGQQRAMVLADHANYWLYAAKDHADSYSLEALSYYDEHDTDIRRAYTTLCEMVGGSKAVFGAMADAYNMPDERQDDCQGVIRMTQYAWDKNLEPAELAGAPSEVKVTYEETSDYAPYRQAMVDGEVLEHAATLITEKYQLPEGSEIVARDCTETDANADEDNSTNSYGLTIQLCYSNVEYAYYLWNKFGRDDSSRDSIDTDDYFGDDTSSGLDEILEEMTPTTGDDPVSDDNSDDDTDE